jgi:hypothetical protein
MSPTTADYRQTQIEEASDLIIAAIRQVVTNNALTEEDLNASLLQNAAVLNTINDAVQIHELNSVEFREVLGFVQEQIETQKPSYFTEGVKEEKVEPKEYFLGYETEEKANRIYERLNGKTYMNFQVHRGRMAGGIAVSITTTYNAPDAEILIMAMGCLA